MPLDPWIIEEIRKREEEKRRREEEDRREQPTVPADDPREIPEPREEKPEETGRGVTVIDIGGNDDDDDEGDTKKPSGIPPEDGFEERSYMRSVHARRLALPLLALALGACGPNVLSARGTVLHPMYAFKEGDTESPRPPRVLVIHRRECRMAAENAIVGVNVQPMAKRMLGEFAQIPDQRTGGGQLFIETLVFSTYKDELAGKGLERYEFWLELPDGRKVKGAVHVQHELQDHTVKITGAHTEPHLVVKDSDGTHVYSHVEEVENDYELYSRWGRVVFKADRLLDRRTPYATFVIKGFGRERRYRFDFTDDPAAAMDSYLRATQ